MSLYSAKQINKIITAPIKITNLSVGSGSLSVSVTSALTSALAIAGNNGVSVPVQVSTDVFTTGIITSSPLNKAEVFDSTSKEKLSTNTNNEVYGRITYSSGYVLSFYYLDSSGIEQTYTFSATQNVDFDFVYRFTFATLPTDALVSSVSRNINQDPVGASSIPKTELLTVTALNVVSNLSLTPNNAANVTLIVNGKTEFAVGSGPSFGVASTTITWNSSNAGYNLETTDIVYAQYYI